MQSIQDFTVIERILRNRQLFFEEIRDGIAVWQKIRSMLVSCITCFAIYGLVMGASHSVQQAISSAVKLPILFILTLIICAPSLYFFNLLFGSRQTLPQNIALILTAITTTAVLLLGFAPITFFFLITTNQYQFYKLLNVGFFTIAGIMGVMFLQQGKWALSASDSPEGAQARRMIFFIWIALYAFVGSQMAWTLSPFMGDPTLPFVVLAQRGGNFYVDVLNSIRALLGL